MGKTVPSVVNDDVKERALSILFSNCPEAENIEDKDSIGQAVGVLLLYGIYVGMRMNESGLVPDDDEKQAMEVMFPEVSEALELAKS